MFDENEKKKILMRSSRRGTKEMDDILGPFALHEIDKLDAEQSATFLKLLEENDLDIHSWVTKTVNCPKPYVSIIDKILFFHAKKSKL